MAWNLVITSSSECNFRNEICTFNIWFWHATIRSGKSKIIVSKKNILSLKALHRLVYPSAKSRSLCKYILQMWAHCFPDNCTVSNILHSWNQICAHWCLAFSSSRISYYESTLVLLFTSDCSGVMTVNKSEYLYWWGGGREMLHIKTPQAIPRWRNFQEAGKSLAC